MSALAEAVEAAFTKFALVYGAPRIEAFYRSQDMATVKAHWCHELRGFTSLDVAYALEHLPPEGIPNVLQFKALCQHRPLPGLDKLVEPKADTARVRAVAEELKRVQASIKSGAMARGWVQALEAKQAQGKVLTDWQRKLLEAMRERQRG